MQRTFPGLGLFLLVFASVFCGGCGRPVEREIEKSITKLLPQYLGPAEKYETHVKGRNVGALTRGRLATVRVEGTQSVLTPTIVADSLTLNLSGVSVDPKSRRIQKVEQADFLIGVGEVNLNRYIKATRPNIPELKATVRGNELLVSARPEIFGFPTATIQVGGNVVPSPDGTALNFAPTEAKVSVVPIPKPVLDFLAKQLNPVLDLSTLRIPTRVTQARVENGKLVFSGAIDPTDLIRAISDEE